MSASDGSPLTTSAAVLPVLESSPSIERLRLAVADVRFLFVDAGEADVEEDGAAEEAAAGLVKAVSVGERGGVVGGGGGVGEEGCGGGGGGAAFFVAAVAVLLL